MYNKLKEFFEITQHSLPGYELEKNPLTLYEYSMDVECCREDIKNI